MTYKYMYQTPENFSNMIMNSDGEYLTGLWFEDSRDSFKHIINCEEKDLEIFKETSKWLDIYFSGKNPNFTPKYKIKNLTPFRQEVTDIMNSIEYGEVVTYKDISKIIAEKRGIKVSLNISKLVENSYLGDMKTKDFKDLTRIIGVYLDNAIEAASTSKDKKLGIEIYEVKGIIQIIISNTYDNAIEKDKVGNERYSTKGKNRGHGLLLVKRILNENNRITSETKITDSLYIQTIKINEK